MEPVKYPILLVCYLSLYVFGFVELSRGNLYPQILSTFAIGAGVGALFFTTSSFVGLLTNMSASWWLKKFGQLKSLYLSLFSYVIGSVCLGLSSQLGIWLHFVGAFFIGISSTGVGITINLLTADAAPNHLRGKALSGLHAMYALAALTVPLFIGLGSKFDFKWEYYFYIAAFAILLIAFKTLTLKNAEPVAAPEKSEIPKGRFKAYIPYAFLFGFYVGGEVLASTRLPYFFQEGLGLSEEISQSIIFRYFLLFFIGRASFIFINVKKYTYRVLQIALVLALTFFTAGIYISPWYFPFAGLGMSVFFPMAMDLVSDRFSKEKEQVVSISFLMVGVIISIFHFSFGQIAEHWGLKFSILLIPTMHFCCYLILLTLRPTKERENHGHIN